MTTTRLCATITADSMAELRRRRDHVAGADLVELRLDGVADVDVAGALAGRRTPVVVTCRPPWQGGRFDGDEATRVALLERAWELGAEYVDVEHGAAEAFVTRVGGARIVRSHHDFSGMPGDIATRLRHMARSADIVKLAVTATHLADVVTLRDETAAFGGRAVVLAMGAAGVTSRILAARLGSCWTYAGDAVAPGQISLDRMRDEFRVQSIDAETAIYGVVGRPVEHSLSPVMHNAAFSAAGMNAVYVPLAAVDWHDFLCFAEAFALRGVSVTAPFKQDARHSASTADALSTRTGAANTLAATASGWEARNTDIDGFLAPLTGRDLRAARVSILGAGGAARAVAAALVDRAARVTVHARRAAAAAALAGDTRAMAGHWPPAHDEWDVLVNTTPVGTTPHVLEAPMAFEGDLSGRLVYDLVYNPPDTALLTAARRLGAETIGGLPMLAAQAAAQFRWWTGQAPSLHHMQAAAIARLRPPSSVPDPV